jgi:hypothetical protein
MCCFSKSGCGIPSSICCRAASVTTGPDLARGDRPRPQNGWVDPAAEDAYGIGRPDASVWQRHDQFAAAHTFLRKPADVVSSLYKLIEDIGDGSGAVAQVAYSRGLIEAEGLRCR